MHFTIPYTEQIVDNDGKKIDIFKIYINGAHHCSARYSRFYSLYEDLKLRFFGDDLPYFPPKRILKLNDSQLEERRGLLEIFLQRVSSSSKFNSHELHEFLKDCQKETKKIIDEVVQIDIYFMDETKCTLNIHTVDHTKTVFDELVKLIHLSKSVSSKFGLFLMELHEDGKVSIIRKLQEFEYPHVSLQEIQKLCKCRVVVRKSVWNTELEREIDQCCVGLQILFAQVASEFHRGWISVPDEARQNRLSNLIERGARKETLKLARTLDYYGYIQLYGTCICSKPFPNTKAIVSTGNFELVFRTEDLSEVMVKYCLTRIKAWKISTTIKDNTDSNFEKLPKVSANFATLTFENLNIDTKKLEEVTITNVHTDQIILLSMSLKSMAEEYVSMKNGFVSEGDTGDNANESKIITNNDSYRAPFMFNSYIGDGDL